MLGPSGKMRNDIATRFAITNEVFQLATDERTFHGGEATAPEMFERHLQPELGTMARKYASSFCGSKPDHASVDEEIASVSAFRPRSRKISRAPIAAQRLSKNAGTPSMHAFQEVARPRA
jgi:hypothetical protein